MGLQGHYEQTYAADADGRHDTTVAPSQRPADRFEACVAGVVRLFDGGSILELGAGSGLVARSLVEAGVDFDRMVVTDFARPRVERLKTIHDGRVEARWLDVEHPDRDLGQFDAILMVALIEHLVDPLPVLADLRAMLRPGGFVWIDTPNIAKWTRRVKLAAGRFPSTASTDEGLTTYEGGPVGLHDQGHLHYFTFRSLERMLIERCGFSRVVRMPYLSKPRGRIGHLLAHARPTLFSEVCVAAYA